VFNPTDFLAIANRFHASASELERRIAVGRSYYAVYNLWIGALSKEGVHFEKNADDHRTLVYYLTGSKVREAERAGESLKNLRISRNDADYAMEKHIDVNSSKFSFERAKITVTQFQALDSTRIKKLAEAIGYLPPPPSRARR